MVSALVELMERHRDLDLVGIPLQPRIDTPELELVLGQLDPDRVSVLSGSEATPRQVVRAISVCDAVIAMRLHACLLSHRLDVPVVGLAYDPKLRHHFAQLGAESNVVPLDVDRATLTATLATLVDQPVRVDRGRVHELERRAETGLRALASDLAARDRPVMYQVPPAPPETADRSAGVGFVADLSGAELVVEGPDTDASIASVELTADRATLAYAIGAPQPEQAIGLRFPLTVTAGEPCVISCTVESPYVRRRNRRWIAYQVLVDGTPVAEEDIALWGPPNAISIEVVPEAPSIDLTVRLVPLRPCKEWSWQRPSRLLIESVCVVALPQGDDLRVGASSPHTRVLTAPDDAEPAPPPPLTGLARTGRGLDRRLARLRSRLTSPPD